jgi:hypothetical protein
LEATLSTQRQVELDFKGIGVTQSFIDELLGPITLRMGSAVLEQVAFKNCSENVRAVVEFVLASRLHDFERRHSPSNGKDVNLIQA